MENALAFICINGTITTTITTTITQYALVLLVDTGTSAGPWVICDLRPTTCDQSEKRITNPLGPRGSDFLNSDPAEFQFSDHRYRSCSESCPFLFFAFIHSHGNFNWSFSNMTFRGTTLINIVILFTDWSQFAGRKLPKASESESKPLSKCDRRQFRSDNISVLDEHMRDTLTM